MKFKITRQKIQEIIREVLREMKLSPKELTEMSGMGGGGVAGAMIPNQEKDDA